MAKKLSRKKLVNKLDSVFSLYVRQRDSDSNGYCKCITCGESSHWKKIQAGHFISRKHYATRWDEENVYAQCIACNVFRYGEQYKYSLSLGQKLSKRLLSKSREIVKFTNYELEDMIEKYKKKLKSFEGS
jgi:hypothetical protein